MIALQSNMTTDSEWRDSEWARIESLAVSCADFNLTMRAILGDAAPAPENPHTEDFICLRLTLGRQPTDDERIEFTTCYRSAVEELGA